MKYFKEILIVCLLTLILFITIRENYYGRIIRRLTNPSTSTSLVKENFDKLYSNNIYDSEIVFLGNSITQGVDWNELLGLNVSNQGVGRNTLEQILLRIDNVIKEHPKHVFIMGGINDLYRGLSVDNIFDTYTTIVYQLMKNDISPIIQSTLFVTSTATNSNRTNNQVKLLNTKLQNFSNENSLRYIDLNKLLSLDNKLNERISTDGVHLNSKGYEMWYEELIPILFSLGYYKNLKGEKISFDMKTE